MGSRTWIKIYCDKWLNGTIREESLDVRAVWVDLLVLAGSGKYGDSGEIKITDQIGFLDQQLADLLQISRQKWATIKKKLNETDRVIIKNGNIICIKNWARYQSEYERTRQYSVTKSTTKSTALDRDRDNRLENIYILLFNHWNQQNVILHKKLTDDMRASIDRVLKNYSAEEVQAAISNYAEIVHGEQYFFKYKWTLKDFLRRGLDKFMDLEIAKSNFRRDEDNGKNRNPREISGKIYSESPDYPD